MAMWIRGGLAAAAFAAAGAAALAQSDTPPALSKEWAGEAPRVAATCEAGDLRFAAAPMFRVVSGTATGRAHFYARKAPCRGSVCAHRRPDFLVDEDVVFAGPVDRGFRCVAGARGGELVGGFLPTEHLVAVAPDAALDPDFLVGQWRRDEASRIRIAGAGLAGLRASGSGVWRGRGTINEGEFLADFRVGADTTATIRDGGCAVTLERRGPYLLANDNGRCGGNNVRFVGIYIKRGTR